MPFAATWMDLEIISKDKSRITHLWNLKYDTNEPNLPHRNRCTVSGVGLALSLRTARGPGVMPLNKGPRV